MMTKRLFIAIVGLILCVSIYAQPANDACGGATTVSQAGCGSPTAGTTVGANDNWVGTVGCQSGNHVEVWYTFVATGTQAQITVTSGTMGGNVEITGVLSSSPPCGGLTIAGYGCGASPYVLTIPTTPGSTYYYTVSSTGSAGTFNTCVLSSSPPPAAGFDCSNAAILCNSNTFSQPTSNSGFGTQEVSTSNSCWGSGGERQSKWFKFSVGCTGTLEFNVNPVTSSNDYDIAVWNITGDPAGCTTKGSTVACNWSGCKGSTGLSSCPNSEPGVVTSGPGCGGGPAAWSSPITVTAGNVYALLVDNFSTSNSGFTLTFGGACGGGTAVIGPDAAFTGVITDMPSPCHTLSLTKTCAISPTTNNTYLWNFGDGGTATTMNASHTYATNGFYTVSLTVTDLLGCNKTTSQVFNIGCAPLPVELASLAGEYDANSGMNNISWSTSSEINNDYFTLEYSGDMTKWDLVDVVNAAGNSNVLSSYERFHDSPFELSYYRLSQTDYDGNSVSFPPIVVEKSKTNKGNDFRFAIYPNPTHDVITLETDYNQVYSIIITDHLGKIHQSQLAFGSNYSIDVSQLHEGIYYISAYMDGVKKNLKFIRN